MSNEIKTDNKMSNEIKTIEGNMEPEYTFPETEIGYYHIQATQVVHDSKKLGYSKIGRVIKLNQANYLKAEKHGGFSDFNVGEGAGVVILHDPTKVEKEDSNGGEGITISFPPEEMLSDYLLLFGEESPGVLTEAEMKDSIKEKSEEMKEAVKIRYEAVIGSKPGNKATLTMLKDIEAKQTGE